MLQQISTVIVQKGLSRVIHTHPCVWNKNFMPQNISLLYKKDYQK